MRLGTGFLVVLLVLHPSPGTSLPETTADKLHSTWRLRTRASPALRDHNTRNPLESPHQALSPAVGQPAEWTRISELRGGELAGTVGVQAILAYQALKILGGPMWVKLSCLAAISYILVLISAALLVCIGYTTDWGHAMFQSYSILNKVPASSSVHASDPIHSFMLNAIYVLRFATFTVALSTVSSSIGSAVEQTLMGNHKKTSERGHVLLINWSSFTVPTLLQLESARKDGRKLSTVVVLSTKPKEEMDEEVAERVGKVGIQILTRHGDPTTVRALDRVSAGAAQMVLVSIPDEFAPNEQRAQELLSTQMACLHILRQRRQPSKQVGARERDVHVVVTAPFIPPVEVLHGACFSPRNDFAIRLLALSALHPGIARVYQELLHSSSGSELYIRGIEAWPWLHGLNFWEAGKYFDNAVVLGWFEGDGESSKICLHPPRDHVIRAGVRLILLAQDSSIKCSRRDLRPRTVAAAPPANDMTEASQPRVRTSWTRGRKVLVLNYRDQTGLLQRLDEALPAGSAIDVQTCSPTIRLPRSRRGVRLQCVATSPLSASSAKQLPWTSYDSCIVLRDLEPRPGSDVDARTLASISFGLEALQSEGGAGEEGKTLHIVVSLQKGRTKAVVRALVAGAGVSVDTVQPELLESGALVQLLISPQLQPLYNHLLSSTSSEIVLLEAAAVVEPGSAETFGHVSSLLEDRGLLALGILSQAGQLTLAPRRGRLFRFSFGDRLVVLNAS